MISNYSESNVSAIRGFLKSKGLNEFAIAGLLANMYAESRLRADNLQNSCSTRLGLSDEAYTKAVDDGSYTNFVHDSAGYGLCQWTSSGRKQKLYDCCKSCGCSIGDINMQLNYLWQELETSYKAVLKTLQGAESVDEAARAVMVKFERPKDQTEAAQKTRVSYGLEFYEKYATKEVEEMINTVDKVINIALAEVGYLEKADNKQLDDKTANVGSANYTKYGRDMHYLYPTAMDFPAAWCDAFVDWCFQKAYGVSNAKALLGGNFDDYTPNSAQLYKNKGAWYTEPKVGDQIFFKNSKRICHTGLVYKVEGGKVYTVEGNTAGVSIMIANGGAVCKKSYALDYSNIAGYGRPAYDKLGQSTIVCNTTGGGYMFEVPNLVKGNTGKAVKLLQRLLVGEGYSVGSAGIDGDFGSATETAVKQFQKDKGIKVNYAGTVGSKTWSKLIGL